MDADRLRALLAAGEGLALELDRDAVLQRLADSARELTRAGQAVITVGDAPNGIVSGAAAAAHAGTLEVPILVQKQPWGRLRLIGSTAAGFTDEDEQTAAILAGWAAVALANAHLGELASSSQEELDRASEAFETTMAVARALSGVSDTDRLLELVVGRSRALLDARVAEVGLLDEDEVLIAASAGDGSHPAGSRLPAAEFLPQASAPDATVAAPLVYHGRVLGHLLVRERVGDDGPFTAGERRLVEAFAASAASAVANQRSATDDGLRLSIAASEAERRRWARELHDETLQELAGIRVLLSAGRRSPDPARWRTAIDDAIELLGGGIQNLRALITDLRPPALDEFGIRAALEALAARVTLQHGLAVDLELGLSVVHEDERGRLTEEIESTIYRFVQEALTNVHKHAGVRRARVELTEDDRHIHVTVQDDGAGFEPQTADAGFGLVGMGERLALVDARLDVESTPRGGTVVRARIPFVSR
jgi:signal transduction histidine kinase